jgi:Xaa-Pro aminopeptidase
MNVRYLCGYSGSNGILLISPTQSTLFTDARYELQASSECFDVEIQIEANLFKGALADQECSLCFFEAKHLSVASLETIKNVAPGMDFAASEMSIEPLRVVKDDAEIVQIRNACKISTSALEMVIAQIHSGQTEKQIAVLLERTMIDLGADAIAFETIVASGPNSAVPHHQPTDRELIQGDLLKIDFGAKVNGYHSDCTRTFVLGKPADWQLEIHQAVLDAQSSSRKIVRAAVSAKEVLEQTTESLTHSGYLQNFRHGLGHGVGLQIHEDPFLSASLATTLEAGTVFTIEPGVYLPNQGGVRIEDTIVVTETGYENLTVFSYELQEIS